MQSENNQIENEPDLYSAVLGYSGSMLMLCCVRVCKHYIRCALADDR